MEFEEQIKTFGTIARRLQIIEKQLHDLYWEVDALTQQMMNAEIKKQQEADKLKTEKEKTEAEKKQKKEVEKK